ncbi:hypothetical protein D3C87_1190830 [compost metagenome]
MSALLDRLTRPVLTDLRVVTQGGDAEFAPPDLPDLYEGEPLILLARASNLRGSITVSGMLDGRPWSRRINLNQAVEGVGVAKLWARRRITDAEVGHRLDQISAEEAAQSIAQLGLDFSIVTRETSLVAVDRTPSRPQGARLTEEELPLNLPAGWDFDRIFGAPAPDSARSAEAETDDPSIPFDLPQTAAAWAVSVWAGLGLALIGGLGLMVMRRRRARS